MLSCHPRPSVCMRSCPVRQPGPVGTSALCHHLLQPINCCHVQLTHCRHVAPDLTMSRTEVASIFVLEPSNNTSMDMPGWSYFGQMPTCQSTMRMFFGFQECVPQYRQVMLHALVLHVTAGATCTGHMRGAHLAPSGHEPQIALACLGLQGCQTCSSNCTRDPASIVWACM